MRLAVIGAGVVGVSTAFELTQDGHQVTVFERCSTAAEGASFANAGLLAPEWMASLASMDWAQERASGLNGWWRRLRRKSDVAGKDPGPDLLALAQLGAERLEVLCDRLQLTPDSHQGMMVVWRDQRDGAVADDLHTRIRAMGGECHLMPAEQARALELALHADTPLHGSLVMPDVWSVNCRQFTLLLRARAQQEGCRFEFGQSVSGIQPGHKVRVMRDASAGDTDLFDAVILCAGAATDTLLGPLGIHLPQLPLTGHALSASVREPMDAPVAVVHDLRHRVSISRMGQRVRVSSSLSGKEQGGEHFKRLYKVLDDWFPGSIRHGQVGGVQEWSTQVSSTPDGLPAIGETNVPRVWVNTGHGMHGWVTAASSARLLADQIGGLEPNLDAGAFSARRWSR